MSCEACNVVKRVGGLKCGSEARESIRAAFKKCREIEMVKPEAITSQEVYLGYVPERDVFLSAWDVFGSHNTGSVLIEFAISEDGKILSSRSKDGDYDRDREVDEICDASDRKFYDKNPSKNDHHGPMSSFGRSLYDIISGRNNAPGMPNLIDIRLD